MAPDINSMPPSPYRQPVAPSTPRRPSEPRRLSERMASPSNSVFPSTPPPHSPSSTTGTFAQPGPREDNTGVDPGPGPLRHPRPLTTADLHMQLEKEQEAIVNRLTRELTLLRQQTASTTSNASSTSASTGITDTNAAAAIANGQNDGNPTFLGSTIIPTSSRSHRSSSNLSSRAASLNTTAATAGSSSSNNASASTSTVNTTAGITGGSGIAPPRDASYYYSGNPTGGSINSMGTTRTGGDPLSRQSSVASRRSEASSPSLSSSLLSASAEQHPFSASPHQHYQQHNRHSHSSSLSTPGGSGGGGTHRAGGGPASNYVPSTQRYDETAHARAELEMMKAENEALKGRIRELERVVASSHRMGASGTAVGEHHLQPAGSEMGGSSEGGQTRVGEA